jgi:YD repeat-containing protein
MHRSFRARLRETSVLPLSDDLPGIAMLERDAAPQRRRRLAAILVLAALAASIFPGGAGATGVQYVYDPAGNLVQKIGPDGSSAQYIYNSTGQMVETRMLGTSTLAATGYSDSNAAPGSTITIYGSGFSTTPSANQVYLNGVAVTVVAATANSLTVVVPAGASGGTFTISNANGTASTSSNFMVGGVSVAPAITSIAPQIAAAGSSVTLSGSNFQPAAEDNVYFTGGAAAAVTAATASSLNVTVPSGYASGRISVQTAYGTASSTQDIFVPPPGRTATDIGATARAQTNNSPVSVPLSTPSRIGMVLFDGQAGQKVNLQVTAQNFPSACASGVLTVLGPSPSSQTIATANFCSGYSFIGLPASGTYTVVVAPAASDTGTMSLSLGVVPPDTVTAIATDGTAATAAFSVPGQGRSFTFQGSAGQSISVVTSNVTLSQPYSGVLMAADGTVVATFSSSGSAFFGPYYLTSTGSYTVRLLAQNGGSGSMGVQVYNVPADAGGPSAADGTAATVNLAVPGQQASFTFTATAGQRFSVLTSNDSLNQWYGGTLLNPDGSALATFTGYNAAFFGPYTVAQSGTYTLKITPQSGGTGSLTVQVYNVPADISSSVSTDGTSSTMTVTAPGQGAAYTFNASSGQVLTLQASADSLNQWYDGLLLNPDGTTAFSFTGYNNRVFGPYTLAQSGTYTLKIKPESGGIGTLTWQLYNVPANVTGTLPTDGTATTLSIAIPGQGATYSFSGSAGQSITLAQSSDSFSATLDFVVRNPDGTTLVSFSAYGNTSHGPYTLQQAGTYTVQVSPEQAATGAVVLKLSNGSSGGGSGSTLPTDGTQTAANITTAGQPRTFTFSGTAGGRISLLTSNSSLGNWYDITISNPDGTSFQYVTGYYNKSFGPYTLAQTGTYTLKVVAEGGATGAVTLQLYNVAPNLGGTIATDGTATVMNISSPGQSASYTFAETSAPCLSLVLSNNGTGSYIDITLRNPDGTTLAAPSRMSGYVGPYCGTQTGTYSIQLVPENASTGMASVQLYNVPADITGTLSVNGAGTAANFAVPGQGATYTFTGVAGQQVSIQALPDNINNWYDGTLRNPDGSTLATFFNYGTNTKGPWTLSQSGTYTLRILPESGGTGTATLLLTATQ